MFEVERLFGLLLTIVIYFVYCLYQLGFTAIWTLLVCIALNQVILRTTLWRTTKKTELDEKVILITGGGSGIGREIAIQLAKLRAIVVIWDIRQNLLDELGKY